MKVTAMRVHRMITAVIGVGVVAGAIIAVAWLAVDHYRKTRQSTTLAALPSAASRPAKKKASHGALIDPSATLALSVEHDDALAAWLEGCSNNPSFKEASPEELQQLKAILDHTPLHAAALFDIAHGFHSSYTAPTASVAFYRAAAAHAHEELSQSANSPADVSKILAASMRNREDMKRLLSPMIEDNHNPDAIDTLCSVYLDFMHYLPKGDRKLAKLGQDEELQILECAFLKEQASASFEFMKVTDPDLVHWLGEWKADAITTTKDATTNQLHRLDDILGRTPLHSPILFDIADAFHSTFTAPLASETFYAAATQHAHDELARNKDSKNEIAKILHAIVRNREDFKHLTWPLIDLHDPQALDTIYTMYSDLLNYAPPGDTVTEKFDASELQLGIGESLFLKGNVSEGLLTLQKIDKESLPSNRRGSLDWVLGEILIQRGEFDDAFKHLQDVAKNPDAHFADQAWQNLVKQEIFLGRYNDAENTLKEYEARPDARTATISVLRQVLSKVKGTESSEF